MKQAQSQLRSLLISPQVSTATVSAAFDTLGADYATIQVAVGTRAAATQSSSVTIAITEADAATGSYTTFNSELSQAVAIGTSAQVAVFHVNLDGTRKRFLRVLSTPGTVATADAVGIAAIGVLDPEIRPSGTTGQGNVVVVA
jgi:hypothetical protein